MNQELLRVLLKNSLLRFGKTVGKYVSSEVKRDVMDKTLDSEIDFILQLINRMGEEVIQAGYQDLSSDLDPFEEQIRTEKAQYQRLSQLTGKDNV